MVERSSRSCRLIVSPNVISELLPSELEVGFQSRSVSDYSPDRTTHSPGSTAARNKVTIYNYNDIITCKQGLVQPN